MADLRVNEKGAGGRSLDHPSFGDVYETTYKKGVISDIQTTADDPIAVAPMVKVQIGDFESGFIPLFFRPKEQYWDGPAAAATEFDSGSKAYKQAWMSFRCGDEVTVMFRQGQPYAVVAFDDRVPRIGENIVKLVLDEVEAWINCHKQEPYEDEDNGPDGKDLQLKTKYEVIYEDHQTEQGMDPDWQTHPHADCIQHYYTMANNLGFHAGLSAEPPGYDEGSGCELVPPVPTVGQEFITVHLDQTTHLKIFLKTYYIKQVLAVVGPILYCFQFYGYEMNNQEFHYSGSIDTGLGANHVVGPPAGQWPTCFPIVPGSNNADDVIAILNSIIAEEEANNGTPLLDSTDWWANNQDNKYKIIAMVVSAGIYTEELYNSIKNDPSAPYDPDHRDGGWDVINEPLEGGGTFTYKPGGECTEQNFYQEYEGLTVQEAMTYDPSSFKFFMSDKLSGTPIKLSEIIDLMVRPHTKDELQAEGMWPDAD